MLLRNIRAEKGDSAAVPLLDFPLRNRASAALRQGLPPLAAPTPTEGRSALYGTLTKGFPPLGIRRQGKPRHLATGRAFRPCRSLTKELVLWIPF
jgi:hypothetical protein